jgi:hypothetical protein
LNCEGSFFMDSRLCRQVQASFRLGILEGSL